MKNHVIFEIPNFLLLAYRSSVYKENLIYRTLSKYRTFVPERRVRYIEIRL
jgi:hypothetical protein